MIASNKGSNGSRERLQIYLQAYKWRYFNLINSAKHKII